MDVNENDGEGDSKPSSALQLKNEPAGKVGFPAVVTTSKSSSKSAEAKEQRNPFSMPIDHDIFVLRDREKQRKKQERLQQQKLHVHEKMTYITKVNQRTPAMIKPSPSEEDDIQEEEDDGKAVTVKEDPQFVLAVTRDRHVEKESLTEYINKKREMFLVQYSLGVKRDEMRKLEEIAQAEEKKLEMAEQFLEEDAAMFDEFLKENDQKSVDAIKAAEIETRSKLEKVSEIKKINAQMMSIKSEISKYEDTLKEYQLYKKFLESLTPKEWLEDRAKEKARKKEDRKRLKEQEIMNRGHSNVDRQADSGSPNTEKMTGGKGLKKRISKTGMKSMLTPTQGGTSNKPFKAAIEVTSDDEESDEELDLYFTSPYQLLNIFTELEEQNLSLIQNSQETEEALEEMKQMIKNTHIKMEKETQILKEQINKLETQIIREEEKAKDLEVKSRMFSYGQFNADDQEKMLQKLTTKVETVYSACIGDNEANINCLQMLTNIENRLEELFEEMEMMPADKVEAAEKMKEKERRLRTREEKIEEQKRHQEERVQKALQRAKAEPKKKNGRKVVPRSEPPKLKKKMDETDDQKTREEEELAYYFSL